MKTFVIASLVAVVCIGCTASDPGDVATAKKGADAAPKSADALPSTMPAEAKASAAAAIGQAKAAKDQNNDPARVHAMEMMRQQHH